MEINAKASNEPPRYVDPLNSYTGEVSVIVMMENLKNGHNTFPENMGNTLAQHED